MSSTDDTSMENYYNYVERIQKRMLRSNLRYLLSIIFQAGLYTGEVDEVPKINVEFNPLWSLTDSEQADLDQKKAATQLTKAQTVQTYGRQHIAACRYDVRDAAELERLKVVVLAICVDDEAVQHTTRHVDDLKAAEYLILALFRSHE